MWGCSLLPDPYFHEAMVFPTHVGMFPHWRSLSSFPHTSSPRMWGCSSASVHALVKAGVFPTHVGFSQKSKNFSFCLLLESVCYISAFNEPILVGSLLNRLCRPSSSLLDRVWELWVAHHISALFVNLTFHLRRNHHVRRICSRS